MAGLILCHLVHGVVDGIVAEFLRALCDRELACAGARFGRDAEFEVLLGRIGDDFAEELCKLACVLCFLEGIALVCLCDLGIALALGNARHGKIHTDLGALALEVGTEAVHHFLIFHLAVADVVLARKTRVLLDGNELRRLADGADFNIIRDDLAANCTSLHRSISPFLVFLLPLYHK